MTIIEKYISRKDACIKKYIHDRSKSVNELVNNTYNIKHTHIIYNTDTHILFIIVFPC